MECTKSGWMPFCTVRSSEAAASSSVVPSDTLSFSTYEGWEN